MLSSNKDRWRSPLHREGLRMAAISVGDRQVIEKDSRCSIFHRKYEIKAAIKKAAF
ncbi:hypothetical protein [Laspinema olomoucense]|uniref:hypothetical protein n=1 Tax=Laspinema olomoucense TaxID=3231600 RepID=UPI0021BB26C9|nr:MULTISPECIES: hypothetical protein [unclassified Laspinema]MCT7991388.1 hypothetical protein [Laspinema sp. D3a]MCT7996016.1 hypothetical protein [Laspinema sp. D3c]